MEGLVIPSFWYRRRVFLTGHTGFKGGWLALYLSHLGAQVRGYALDPGSVPNFFGAVQLGDCIEDTRGDIRDGAKLDAAMQSFQPEVVFHLAAQPLVRLSYADPVGTYETNVIGTARVLDAVRRTPSVRAIVSVTTDKVYENKEWAWPYREADRLGGYDPYSSSKACAEMVTAAYRSSYFSSGEVRIAAARAGNVIGGGDWSEDRLLPDLVRGFLAGEPVLIRRPHAVRPWQHVLEPIYGYLLLAEKLLESAKFATSYNFGPPEEDAKPVEWIAAHLAQAWGEGARWELDPKHGVHEAGYLRLDSSRARSELGWSPQLRLASALDWLVQWCRADAAGQPMQQFSLEQITAYEALCHRL